MVSNYVQNILSKNSEYNPVQSEKNYFFNISFVIYQREIVSGRNYLVPLILWFSPEKGDFDLTPHAFDDRAFTGSNLQ